MSKKLSFSIALNLLTENFKRGANTVKNTFRSMQMQILTFAAALGAGGLGLMGLISRMKDVARETSRVITALKNVSGGTAQFADNLKFLNSLAHKYGLGINILTGAYAKFTASATNAGVSIENQKKIFESVSRANAAFALSSDESSGVMLALSQMMGKGKISSEELRKQMGEKLPVAMAAMAKAAGTTIGGLEPLLKQGKLMAADILPKFADALNEIIPNVDTDNIESSLNRLSNMFNKFTEEVGIGAKFKVIVDEFTALIEIASKNIHNIILGIVAAIVFVVANGATKVLRSHQAVGNQIIANAESANAKMLASTAARQEAEIALDKAKSAAFFATEKQRLQAAQAVAKAEIALRQRVAAETKAIEASKLADAQAAAIKTGGFWLTTWAAIKGTALRAGAAMKSMWNTFAPALIITALITVGYKIYDLVTATSKAQKAVEDFNTEARSQEKELNGVFNAYKKANDGTKEKAKLLDIIKSKYGEYIQGLIDEKGNIRDIETAQRLANKALRESIALKVKNAAINKVATEEIEKQSETLGNLRKAIASTEGDTNANIITTHIGSLYNDDGKSAKEAKEEALKYIENLGINKMQKASKFSGKAIVEYLNDLGKSADKIKKETKDIENSFLGLVGEIGESGREIEIFEPDRTSSPVYGKLYREAKNEWEDAKKGLAAIEKDKDKFTKEQYEDAKTREETAKKAFDDLGGNTKNNDSAVNKAQKLSEDKLEALRKLDEADRQRQLDKIAFDNEMRQRSIDNMDEGFLKEFAQLKLNNDRELQEIEEFKKKMAKAQIDELKNQYVSKHGNTKGFEPYLKTVKFDKALPDGLKPEDIANQAKALTDAANAAYESGYKKINKDLSAFREEERLRFASQLDQQLFDINRHYAERLKLAKGDTELTKELLKNRNKETESAVLQSIGKQLEYEMQYNQKVQELTSGRYLFETDKRKASLRQQIADQQKIFNNLDKQSFKDPHNQDLANRLKDALVELKRLKKESKDLERNEFFNKVGEATGVFSSLRSTLGDFGIEFSDNINKALDGVGQMLDGLASIDITNPFSIASGSIQALGGLAKTFSGIFGGGGFQISESTLERYNTLMETMDKLISKQKEVISSMSGKEAVDASKQAQDLVKRQIDETKNLGRQWMDVRGSGSSKGVRIKERLYSFQKELAEMGIDYHSLGGRSKGIYDLPVETLEKLRENLEIWNALGEETRDYITTIIESQEKLEELQELERESLTGVSFDSLKDSFLDTLMDMDSSAKDFAESFASYLQKAILKTMLDDLFSDKLDEWYKKFARYNEDGDINDWEYNDLQSGWESIVNGALAERDKLKDIFGWTSDGSFSQDSSKGYSVSMDQDTGGAILGRITGLHETGIMMREMLSGISISTNNIFSQTVSMNDELKRQTVLLDEIKQVQVKSFFEIEGMNQAIQEQNNKLDKIDKNTKDL